MSVTLLQQAVIFLAAAIVSVPVSKCLGFRSVLGYFAAGIIVGPFGLVWRELEMLLRGDLRHGRGVRSR